MLAIWITIAVVTYLLLLAGVLIFFTSVRRADEWWVRVFRKTHSHARRDRRRIPAA